MTGRPSRLFMNPGVTPGLRGIDAPTRSPLDFLRKMPGYQPTPLTSLPGLAEGLGLDRLQLKDESSRFGLPAFKVLGAWWAAYLLLCERLGGVPEWETLTDLRAAFSPLRPLTLVAFTDGNHGRAVARFARMLGLSSRVFVPSFAAAARIAAIRSEGAEVEIINGTYEDALAAAVAASSERAPLIADDAWPGYEKVPRWVVEGYSTMFWEIEDEHAARDEPVPTAVFVQMGVGALATAVVAHYRARRETDPLIVGVEPLCADCVLESLQAGELRDVPGPHTSMMANLNCGRPSSIALPVLASGMTACVAIDDDWAVRGMRDLAAHRIEAGVTGVAGFAGLLAVLGEASPLRERLLHEPARVLVLCTEGRATDPHGYDRIIAALDVDVEASVPAGNLA